MFHPPSAATALIAAMGSESVPALGFFWVIMPVASGAVTLSVVAWLFNNLIPSRSPWPVYWLL